jgi:hypothetical protein
MAYRDYVAIIPGKLYQGSAPPEGGELHALGFDVVVLTAEEYQPNYFPGVQAIHAPFDDSFNLKQGLRGAVPAARLVAAAVRAGGRVLVTCHMGLNRSGLVTALALWELGAGTGAQVVEQVKAARRFALNNPIFANWLRTLPLREAGAVRKAARAKLTARRAAEVL